MKVEIELNELEALRAKIKRLEEEINQAENRLKQYDDKAIYELAVKKSFWLFERYIDLVFKELGFDCAPFNPVQRDNLLYYLGENWWKSNDVEIEISAEVSAKFRRAFLRMGVRADRLEKGEFDYTEELMKNE